MAKYPTRELDTVFSALSDPTRRAILEHLIQGEQTVSQLAEPFESALPTISKHIKVLEEAGLVTRQVEGRTHYLHLEAIPLREALDYLARYRRFWQETFSQLDKFLEQQGDGSDE